MSPETASAKDMYEALRSNLKELYTLFFDGYVKATGSYILIIGWLITSDKARDYICRNTVVFLTVMITVAVISALYLMICRRVWRKSRRIVDDLDGLGYMEQKFYSNYIISRHSYFIIVLAYLFIVAVLCTIFTNVYLCRGK